MKSYDWGVFLLILSMILANIVSTQAAGKMFFAIFLKELSTQLSLTGDRMRVFSVL